MTADEYIDFVQWETEMLHHMSQRTHDYRHSLRQPELYYPSERVSLREAACAFRRFPSREWWA
jgi:hypothetical protein